MFKKVISLCICLVMIFSGTTALAAETVQSSQIEIDGIMYTTTVELIDGITYVETSGSDGSFARIEADSLHNQYIVESNELDEAYTVEIVPNDKPLLRASTSTSDMWWGYSTYRSDSSYWDQTSSSPSGYYGWFWSFTADVSPYSSYFFDYQNSGLQIVCNNFKWYVESMRTEQLVCIGALGTTGASVVAAVIGGAPTLGLSVIIAAITAVGGTITCAINFFNAWSHSKSADDEFRSVQNMLAHR